MTALTLPILTLLTLRALAAIRAARVVDAMTRPIRGVVVTDTFYTWRCDAARKVG